MHCNATHARKILDAQEIDDLRLTLPEWDIAGKKLIKTFEFIDYYETIAFVNALAWICHKEDHHPDLFVQYNRVRIEWSTHDTGTLTLNDFICAAKCEALRPKN
jgi:4a-hydroxytetrahydrobiopterin dehydratase